MSAADLRLQGMNRAGESIRRKPLHHRVGIKKRAVNFFGISPQHAMQFDFVCSHSRGSPRAKHLGCREQKMNVLLIQGKPLGRPRDSSGIPISGMEWDGGPEGQLAAQEGKGCCLCFWRPDVDNESRYYGNPD
jgi:hypothetical protein